VSGADPSRPTRGAGPVWPEGLTVQINDGRPDQDRRLPGPDL